MKFWQLFITFFKIGAFSFGGGYAMIPFFEKEIIAHGWTAAGDYAKIIAIAQVFPGPFAVDSSAYIGYQVSGLLGAIIATIGLCLPSFIALVYISRHYARFQSYRYVQMLLGGVRPVVIGLLISAAYIIGFQPIFKTWRNVQAHSVLGIKAVLLMGGGFLLLKYTKMNPVIYIIIFGVIGGITF